MTPDDLLLLAPALAAGLVVLATHVPLGREVLARGIIFLDLAIAQIAATGVLATGLLLHDHDPLLLHAGALAAALAGAWLLSICERRAPAVQEAIIGSAFVLAATLGLLLLAADAHGGEALRDVLAGQILWVTWEQLLPVLSASVLVLLLLRYGRGSFTGFYLPFALAVTLSVQLVGVYLVFSSLILPALAVRGLPARQALPLALLVGGAGYATGLLVAWPLDLPAGPAAVWGLALCALLAGLVRRRTPAGTG